MPWMPGCPRTDDDNGHGAGGGVQCGIMHMTYGSWAGDVATVVNSGLCTWVVGKEQGQWLQLMDSDSISYNVGNWDCNQHSVAIEFTGVNEDVLTDWQVEAGAKIVAWVRDTHHVEVKYDDGADGSNDTSPWSGWYAHRAVMPDSGSQHSDFIDRSEWDRIVAHIGGTSAPTTDDKESGMFIMGTTEGKFYLFTSESGVEIDGGLAYALAIHGMTYVPDQNPLTVVGTCVKIAQAKKNAAFWASKLPA